MISFPEGGNNEKEQVKAANYQDGQAGAGLGGLSREPDVKGMRTCRRKR